MNTAKNCYLAVTAAAVRKLTKTCGRLGYEVRYMTDRWITYLTEQRTNINTYANKSHGVDGEDKHGHDDVRRHTSW